MTLAWAILDSPLHVVYIGQFFSSRPSEVQRILKSDKSYTHQHLFVWAILDSLVAEHEPSRFYTLHPSCFPYNLHKTRRVNLSQIASLNLSSGTFCSEKVLVNVSCLATSDCRDQ